MTKQLRAKYRKRPYGNNVFDRYPPGGEDVIRLCDLCERLERLVRDCQRQLPTDQQNEIERRLWAAGALDAKVTIWTPQAKDLREFLSLGGNREMIECQTRDLL